MSRLLVAGEHRIEFDRARSRSPKRATSRRDGLFTERIDYKVRYFVPTEPEEGAAVLKRLLQYRPVSGHDRSGRAADDDMAAGDEAMFESAAPPAKDGREGFTVAPARSPTNWRTRQVDRAASCPELDRLGLHDKLGLEDVESSGPARQAFGARRLSCGKTYLLNGHYLPKRPSPSRSMPDNIRQTHAAMKYCTALRDLGLFKDSEWGILSDQGEAHLAQAVQDRPALQPPGRRSAKTEEGVAHAYADWATGKIKVDGRIARLFKRIRDFFEALRNALHGLGFKTAEDVFRDIRSERSRPSAIVPASAAEPMLSVRDEPANTNARRRIQTVTEDGGENLQELIDDASLPRIAPARAKCVRLQYWQEI